MNFFTAGLFALRSGYIADFKIECDGLDAHDWMVIAGQIAKRSSPFGECVGVPRGGLPLAQFMQKYVTKGHPRLVVDDVLSTGYTITQFMDRKDDFGWVAFARGPLPFRVNGLFLMDMDPKEAAAARMFMAKGKKVG